MREDIIDKVLHRLGGKEKTDFNLYPVGSYSSNLD